MAKIWINLLTETQVYYYATNYINPDEIYTTNWAKAALLLQNAKKTAVGKKFNIRKVFFAESDHEILRLSYFLFEQKQAGVDIHYVPYHVAIDTDIEEKIRNSYYESIDFGVFDERIVLIWKLDGRKLVGGRLLLTETDSTKYVHLFERLFKGAVDYNANKVILIDMDKSTRDSITKWPDYGAPYEEMNYAIHSQKEAWLLTFAFKSSCRNFAAFEDGELVGFTILDCETNKQAEFYVAIHPYKVGEGYGKKLTEQTLQKAFAELHLETVHLRVRKNLQHRIDLYTSVGFSTIDPNVTDIIDGKNIELIKMEITKANYLARYGK